MAQTRDDRLIPVGSKVSFYYRKSTTGATLQRVGIVEGCFQSYLCIRHANGDARSYRFDRIVGQAINIHGVGQVRAE